MVKRTELFIRLWQTALGKLRELWDEGQWPTIHYNSLASQPEYLQPFSIWRTTLVNGLSNQPLIVVHFKGIAEINGFQFFKKRENTLASRM